MSVNKFSSSSDTHSHTSDKEKDDTDWIIQAREARLSDDEVSLLEHFAIRELSEKLPEKVLQHRNAILTKMAQLDFLRAEALVHLSNRWDISVAAVVQRIGLTYPRDFFINR